MTTAAPSPRSRVYGIDFSGARDAGNKVWIAGGVSEGGCLRVERCASAAEWLGVGPERDPCLAALSEFVAQRGEAAVGLDFPFGLPVLLVTEGSWVEFVFAFGGRHNDPDHFSDSCQEATAERWPGRKEIKRVTDIEAHTPSSPYNRRIKYQTFYGIRDVLAPLVRNGAAWVLPMQPGTRSKPWVLEICPSSTMRDRKLPHQGYKKGAHPATLKQRATREHIPDRLIESEHLAPLDPAIRTRVLADTGGDALDSIVAAVATARAVSNPGALYPGGPDYTIEGYVYV